MQRVIWQHSTANRWYSHGC